MIKNGQRDDTVSSEEEHAIKKEKIENTKRFLQLGALVKLMPQFVVSKIILKLNSITIAK